MLPLVLGNVNYGYAQPFEEIKVQRDESIFNKYAENSINCPKLDFRMDKITRFSQISQLENTLNLERQTTCKYLGETQNGHIALKIQFEDSPNNPNEPIKINLSFNYNQLSSTSNYRDSTSGKNDNSVLQLIIGVKIMKMT